MNRMFGTAMGPRPLRTGTLAASSMVSRLSALALAAALAGCAAGSLDAVPGSEPVRAGASEIQVEVYRGLSAGSLVEPGHHVVVDVAPMSYPDSRPEDPAVLQQQAARMLERLELALPEQPQPILHPFLAVPSGTAAETCPDGSGRPVHASSALGELRSALAAEPQSAPAKVLLVADLNEECAPRLCGEARSLIQAGAWIDFVQLGSGTAPECIAELRPAAVEPSSLRSVSGRAQVGFRVEAANPAQQNRVLARGQAASAPLEVGPGYRTIVVELNPEERIGPIRVDRGQRIRVRLLDFPLSAPTAREWTIEVQDATP